MSSILCEQHGPSQSCLICTHLREQSGLGYYAIEASGNESAQAWCEECDRVLAKERGWTDFADQCADWQLFCSACYEDRLRKNRLLSWVEGSSAPD